MKAFAASDLHLEFHPYEYDLPEADIALLAGDILTIAGFGKSGTKRQDYNALPFLDAVSAKYKEVYAVAGNHEFYHADMGDGILRLKTILKQWPNIRVLDDESVMLSNGTRLIGSTLWTDFGKNNPVCMEQAKSWMTDYRVIANNGERITPEFIYGVHKKSLKFLSDELRLLGPKIVMTHHSPTYAQTHDRFKFDYDGNGLFHSELSYLFGPDILYWLHGHIHDRMSTNIMGTKVEANPRGYPGENLLFDPNFVLEF